MFFFHIVASGAPTLEVTLFVRLLYVNILLMVVHFERLDLLRPDPLPPSCSKPSRPLSRFEEYHSEEDCGKIMCGFSVRNVLRNYAK
jgi:hypothetical protein